MKKLSIIIPFYNTKKEYFAKCKDGLLNQDCQDFEIIIIDDGSDKEFQKEFHSFEILDNTTVVHTENKGVSNARNLGLELARGEYVIFLDSDDWLENNACSQICEMVSSLPRMADIIITNAFINSDERRFLKSLNSCNSFLVEDKQRLLETIFKKSNDEFACVDTPWAKVYRREFLVENNIKFNSKLKNGEDGLFNFEVYLKANNIYFSEKVFYNYFVNNESTCNSYSIDMCQRFLNLIEEYVKFFELNSLKKEKKYFDYFVIRIICRLIRKYFRKIDNYKQFKREMKSFLKDRNIKNSLKLVKCKDLESGKKFVYFLCKLKLYFCLYKLSKSKLNIK